MMSNQNLINYKGLDIFVYYNFDIKFVFIRLDFGIVKHLTQFTLDHFALCQPQLNWAEM